MTLLSLVAARRSLCCDLRQQAGRDDDEAALAADNT